MARGKKFDAAEKHFYKEKCSYERRIKTLSDNLKSTTEKLALTERRLDEAENEITQLKDWVERLLEYTELSREDIKAACEKDKRLAGVASLLTMLRGVSCY